MLKLVKDLQERAEMDAWYSRRARANGDLGNAAILQKLSAREYAQSRDLLDIWFETTAEDDRIRSLPGHNAASRLERSHGLTPVAAAE